MNTYFRHIHLAALAALFGALSSCAVLAPADPFTPGRLFSRAELEADLDQLADALGIHPVPFSSPAAVEAAVAAARGSLADGQDVLTAFRVFSETAAAARCGHTVLGLSPDMLSWMGHSAPYPAVEWHLEADRIHVFADHSGLGLPPGTELLSLNGRPVAEVLRLLRSRLSADGSNTTRKDAVIRRWFGSLVWQLVDASGDWDLVVRRPGADSPETLRVPGAPGAHASGMGVFTFPAVPWAARYADGYAVLELRSFAHGRGAEFKAFLGDFFTELRRRGIGRLVVDLRGNWGGTPEPGAIMLEWLVRERVAYYDGHTPFLFLWLAGGINPRTDGFRGKVDFLADGACFSATGHFLALVKQHRIGTIWGEESGGGPLCSDASEDTVLRHTGFVLHHATATYRTATPAVAAGRGIVPDKAIAVSIAERLAGRDPVLEAVPAGR